MRTGSAAVLDGSIVSPGSQYVLGLRARNCANDIAARFRTRVGESLSTIKSHNKPLQEATTRSLEALKAYSSGLQVNFSSGAAAAVPLFKRAVEIDPQFAMAYALLGRMYGDMGETVLSAESIRKAYQLRDHASDRERFFIDAHYDRQVTGNIEKVRETLESWIQTYPSDPHAHGMLSGFTSQGIGNYELSIQQAQKAIELDPDFTPGYFNMALSYLYLDRLSEAESTIQKASERKLDVPDNLMLRFYVAFIRGDAAGMQREAALAKGRPGAEDWMPHSEALVQAQSGRLQLARDLSRRGMELALASDYAQTQSLAGDLEKRFPEDTLVRIEYLPALRALFALHAKAIELLQTTEPYDSPCRRPISLAFSAGFIRCMSVDRRIWRWDRARLRQPSFRKFSITAGWWWATR